MSRAGARVFKQVGCDLLCVRRRASLTEMGERHHRLLALSYVWADLATVSRLNRLFVDSAAPRTRASDHTACVMSTLSLAMIGSGLVVCQLHLVHQTAFDLMLPDTPCPLPHSLPPSLPPSPFARTVGACDPSLA
jgi:hypothetical protein